MKPVQSAQGGDHDKTPVAPDHAGAGKSSSKDTAQPQRAGADEGESRSPSGQSQLEEPQLVLIEWDDAVGCGGGGAWADLVVERPYPSRCMSAGWLVQKNERCLTVVPHVSLEEEDNRQGCGEMTIPMGCVVRIRPLVDSRKD